MSDEIVAPAGPAGSAGAMLRQAREAAGLPLETLSATIKVAQRKLESLEADRYDELPDAVFTRALALAICRALKIDATPVLALLPPAKEARGLEHVTQGLNQPFDERGHAVGRMLGDGGSSLLRPAVLAPLCLVGGALALYFWPHTPQGETEKHATEVVASAPSAAEVPASVGALPSAEQDVVANMPPPHASEPPDVSPNAGEFPQSASGVGPAGAVAIGAVAASRGTPVAAAPVVKAAAPASSAASATVARVVAPPAVSASAAASSALPTGGDAVALKAREDSWIEVRDAKGHVLLSRLVRAGEALDLSGVAPMQVKIGNARGTDLQFRGRPVDLSGAAARDNVARMELK